MKIYFDTGIIFPRFECQVRGRPNPRVSRFLYNIKDRHEYLVSNLTKAEIFRRLHNDLGVDSKDCYALWSSFRKSMDIKEIIIEKESEGIDFEQIAKMMSERPAPRNIIVNLLHLQIAKSHDLTILTSDKPLKDRFKIYYRNVISYDELRGIS